MPRVMPSSTKPESVIIAVVARSSQTSVFGNEGSRVNTGSAISRLRVRQWSADIRSRRLKATRESWRRRWLSVASGLVAARRNWRGTFLVVDSIRPSCLANTQAGWMPTLREGASSSTWPRATRSSRTVASQRSL